VTGYSADLNTWYVNDPGFNDASYGYDGISHTIVYNV
jgi:hypothetical protein